MKADYYYLRRTWFLANLGIGKVSPNPMVGAVLVHNEVIIGEGFHQYYGGPHAEVNALKNVKECDRDLIPDSTLYISLEPCNFYGKTPPCTELILKNGIRNVVICDIDQTAEVSGKAVKYLESKNVNIKIEKTGSNEFNPSRFRNVFTRFQRPYIIIKYACSKDDFIGSHESQIWLSNAMSNRFSHVLRSYSDGIMIGKYTAITDGPSLNTRLVPGRSPVKILIDKLLEVPQSNTFYTSAGKIIVFNFVKNHMTGNVEYILLKNNDLILEQILHELFKRNIGILLVEGGSATIQKFIDRELYDEIYEIRTNRILKKGISKPSGIGDLIKIYTLRDDIILKKFVNRLQDC